MKNNYIFTVLGAGQEIGASCYCLEFGNNKILLDCGKGQKRGIIYGPDFLPLKERQILMQEINSVFISHAHFDHIGYISEIFKMCGNVPIYASRLTAELGRVLLWDNIQDSCSSIPASIMKEYCENFEKTYSALNKVNFCSPIDFGSYQVTFFEAGHIPGAAMIYLESESGTVLFTGDFSTEKTSLTNGAVIPDSIKADTLIIDGTFAKRPGHMNYGMFDKAFHQLNSIQYAPVQIKFSQLTKGIEILNYISAKIEQNLLPQVPIYMDEVLWNVVQAFINTGINVLGSNCYLLNLTTDECRENAFYITSASEKNIGNAVNVQMDFSLHAGFDDLLQFIEKHAKRNVIVVHSPNPKDNYTNMKYALEEHCDYRLNFIYPQKGESFQI